MTSPSSASSLPAGGSVRRIVPISVPSSRSAASSNAQNPSTWVSNSATVRPRASGTSRTGASEPVCAAHTPTPAPAISNAISIIQGHRRRCLRSPWPAGWTAAALAARRRPRRPRRPSSAAMSGPGDGVMPISVRSRSATCSGSKEIAPARGSGSGRGRSSAAAISATWSDPASGRSSGSMRVARSTGPRRDAKRSSTSTGFSTLAISVPMVVSTSS